MTTKPVIAEVTRAENGWWAVEVPAIEGLFTQARSLHQVPAMVADAARLLDEDVTEGDVRLRIILPPEVQTKLDKAKADARAAEEAQRKAAEETREVVAALRSKGFTVRDAAVVLGVSPQRVSQLAAV